MNLFEAIFAERSSSVAVLCEDRRLTYDELRSMTSRFAGLWQSLGIGTGERVALLLYDSPEFIAAFISICSSGAIAVPINTGLRPQEQQAILRDCTARVLLVELDLLETFLNDPPSSLENVIVVGHAQSRTKIHIHSLEDLLESANEVSKFATPGQDTPAFILYTSGSTGEPKGAVHCQSDIFYTNQTYCREVLVLRGDDRLFSSSRLPFAYGLGNALTFPLLNGVTTVLCREKPSPDVISRVLRTCKPTILFGVPVVYNLLLDHHRRVNELDCSSLRLCISAGEALPAQLGEQWQQTFGVDVLDGIGSTEMLHMFMSNHEGQLKYGSSGTVLDGYEARLLDAEGQPATAEGNLWIKGASAARNYWQRPDETALTFVDGWVRTGDLYRCDEDGYWFHMGRSDDCFKSSGQWVSPVEVEGVLVRHPGVARAAVVEDFDEAGLPCPCAFVVCSDSVSETSSIRSELETLTREALPRFKRPHKYCFVRELPYTATGKIQRFKLREELHNQR